MSEINSRNGMMKYVDFDSFSSFFVCAKFAGDEKFILISLYSFLLFACRIRKKWQPNLNIQHTPKTIAQRSTSSERLWHTWPAILRRECSQCHDGGQPDCHAQVHREEPRKSDRTYVTFITNRRKNLAFFGGDDGCYYIGKDTILS